MSVLPVIAGMPVYLSRPQPLNSLGRAAAADPPDVVQGGLPENVKFAAKLPQGMLIEPGCFLAGGGGA